VSTPPFEAVHWRLVSGRTALVLIDLQNDFLHPHGWYARSGIDVGHMRRVIEPTKELVRQARQAGLPIVWTRHGFREETAGVFFALRPFLREGGLRHGTWGHDVYEEFTVEPEDFVSHKSRLSAFYNTDLELILRGVNADTVLFTGVLTNQCVAASSKDANFRDFKPVVIAECTGTTMPHLHEPALEMMKVGWAEVRSLDDTIPELSGLATVASR
jgi:ureidoacrylate peracid hydrolase